MDLQLLDQLEEKVDVTITTVNELRMENSLLREETSELQKKIQSLTKELGGAADGRAESIQYKARCEELEERFNAWASK